MTTQTVGKFFIASGVFSVVNSVVLYFIAPIEVKFGLILNMIFFTWDCFWYMGVGAFWLMTGFAVYTGKSDQTGKIKAGGYLFIFTVVFWVTSLVFNFMAKPVISSNGRIFTFGFQTVSRLRRPSLTPDFLVPMGGIVFFVLISIWYKRVFLKQIT